MLSAEFLLLTQNKLIIAVLILVRISGLFAVAQFFNNINIPVLAKVGIILILTMTLAPLHFDSTAINFNLLNMLFLVLKEFFVGAILGFASNIFYWAVRFGGGLIDAEMGYQTSLMFDPTSGAPTLIGEFYSLAATIIFLYLNGHHFIIETLFLSMRVVPLTTFAITNATLQLLFTTMSSFMMLGMKIAAPLLITLFNTNLALTLLARVAPQMNIFMLSFQVKIAVGILVLLASVPLLGVITKQALAVMETGITQFLFSLNPNFVM